ncbi:MAG: DNA cytosine methyltransferase, partial [Solirubrobacteraceae bacterium]
MDPRLRGARPSAGSASDNDLIGRLAVRALPEDEAEGWGLIDLFAGCGGASAGFLASGAFTHLYAADIDEWAVATYKRNLGHTPERVDLGA